MIPLFSNLLQIILDLPGDEALFCFKINPESIDKVYFMASIFIYPNGIQRSEYLTLSVQYGLIGEWCEFMQICMRRVLLYPSNVLH